MDEETKQAIEVAKQILETRKTENVEQQRKICKEAIKYRKQRFNGKPLTTSEQLILHEIELTGYKHLIDHIQDKFKQFFIENVLLLVANVVLIIYIFTKIL